MSKVVRSVKNVTKGYSQSQVKVRNGLYFLNFEEALLTSLATSNDAWGPTGAEMAEIAQLTFAE
jgi:epsin